MTIHESSDAAAPDRLESNLQHSHISRPDTLGHERCASQQRPRIPRPDTLWRDDTRVIRRRNTRQARVKPAALTHLTARQALAMRYPRGQIVNSDATCDMRHTTDMRHATCDTRQWLAGWQPVMRHAHQGQQTSSCTAHYQGRASRRSRGKPPRNVPGGSYPRKAASELSSRATAEKCATQTSGKSTQVSAVSSGETERRKGSIGTRPLGHLASLGATAPSGPGDKRHPECLAHVWVSGSPDQLRRCVSQSDTVRLLLRRAAQSPADEPTKPANGSEPMRWAPTRAPAGIDPRTDLIPLAQRSTAYLDQHTSVPGSAQGTSRTPPLVTLVLVSRTSCFRPIHPSWAPRNQESGIPCQGIPLRRSAVRRKIPTFLLNGATNVEETPGSCALAQDFGVSL